MMAMRGRRAKNRRSKDIYGIISISIVVLIIIIGTGYYYIENRPQNLNDENLCPSSGPQGHYILLIDKTDSLNFTQKQSFNVILKDLVGNVPKGYLLSVFALGENFEETAKPLVELCNPGDGSKESELTANIGKLQAKYKSRFLEPVSAISESLLISESEKLSPILEMVQLVGVNGFRKHGVNGERRLIIVSDMLHNTPQFSMYKEKLSYADFSKLPYGRKTQSELLDVEIELHYLINRPELQTKRNLKFWEDYFINAGGRIVSVRPMEG